MQLIVGRYGEGVAVAIGTGKGERSVEFTFSNGADSTTAASRSSDCHGGRKGRSYCEALHPYASRGLFVRYQVKNC